MKRTAAAIALALMASPALAEDNFNIETGIGEAIISTEIERDFFYGEWHFAPAYRVGDFVFFSGVVAGSNEPGTVTPEAYQEQLRQAFSRLQATLEDAGTSFENVVKLRTFHVFDSPFFEGDKRDHINAFRVVKDEFMPAPYPAWTAIGIDELLPDAGLVEIELIAIVPEAE